MCSLKSFHLPLKTEISQTNQMNGYKDGLWLLYFRIRKTGFGYCCLFCKDDYVKKQLICQGQ